MGAFIGYGDIGVWASNRERDAFLDWFASNRCEEGDDRWKYCKSPAQRWTGRCIELADLIPQGQILELSGEEYERAANQFWPHVAQLLGIIESITRGEWQICCGNQAAENWRRPNDLDPNLSKPS